MEAGVNYKLGDHGTLYARYSEGYRSGGINSGAAARTTADPFGPETVETYEIGAKSRLPGHLGSVSIAAYRADYSDLQQTVTIFDNASPLRLTRNAANAVIKGVEAEVSLTPVPQFTLTANGTYTDAKYKDYFADLLGTGTPEDFSFLTLPLVSKWTGY